MKTNLTPKQQDILDFVMSSFQDRGLYPTLREIGRRFGVSVGALWYMVFLSKPQSYTVGSGLSELSSVDTEVEEASAFICAPFPSHGFGSNLSDDDVKAATTAGYIGVYGPPN